MYGFLKISAVSVLSATLLACGGGGGDSGSAAAAGPSAATADINSTGYAGTADGAARSTLAGFSSLALFTGSGGVVTAAASTRALAFDATVQRLAMGKLIERSQTQAADRVKALALTTTTQACDSGSLLFSINEANATAPTPGDSITVTSQNCVVAAQTVSGSVKLTLSTYSATATTSSGTADVVFTGFGIPALSLTGNVGAQFAEDASNLTVKLGYQGLTVAAANAAPVQWFHTVDYSLDLATGSATVAFSGLVGVADGYVRLDQFAPFTLSSGQPSGGTLQLTGANGARVRIIAGTTRFTYAFYAAGNSGTTADATAQGLVY